MPTITDLRRDLATNDELYAARFAGHSRATRDLDLIDDMIARAQVVAADCALVGGPRDARAEVAAAAARQLELLRGERTLIAQARQGGDDAWRVHVLGERANAAFHRYARHFAGKDRATRDVTLIAEVIADLGKIGQALRDLAATAPSDGTAAEFAAIVAGRLELFTSERVQIARAQADGSHDEQAGSAAGVANNLFAQYDALFAGQPRVSRRPETLVRMTGALGQIRERMRALQAQGLRGGSNDGNIAIVEERLAHWHQELEAIRAARRGVAITGLASDLGTAANAEFETWGNHFAGQDRKTRNIKRLADLIDRLDEVERQMTRIDEAGAGASNRANLGMVRDNLTLYQSEYDRIAEVQRG